jgi:hypothetical protein
MAELFEELRAMHGKLEPLFFFFHLIIEHGERPHLPSLKPDVFVGIVNVSLTIEACQVTPVFLVLRMVQPKRDNVVEKLILIDRTELFQPDSCLSWGCSVFLNPTLSGLLEICQTKCGAIHTGEED